ncbi:site-specific integrase, partial [Clavibacter michiganensis]|uniref:site-specific integrase n=1 Tax=Clavibacter michiganensis TaxID=28447 RepID=UPI00292DBF56
MEWERTVEGYLQQLADVRRLAPATVRADRSDLADLRSHIGDVELDRIDLEELRSWLWSATQAGS